MSCSPHRTVGSVADFGGVVEFGGVEVDDRAAEVESSAWALFKFERTVSIVAAETIAPQAFFPNDRRDIRSIGNFFRLDRLFE